MAGVMALLMPTSFRRTSVTIYSHSEYFGVKGLNPKNPADQPIVFNTPANKQLLSLFIKFFD